MSITAKAISYWVLLIISLTPLDLITAWMFLSTLLALIFFIKSQFLNCIFSPPTPQLFFWLLIPWIPHTVLNYMLISEYLDSLSRRQISESSEINFPTLKILGTSFQLSHGISWWCCVVWVSPHLQRAAPAAAVCPPSHPSHLASSKGKSTLINLYKVSYIIFKVESHLGMWKCFKQLRNLQHSA